MPKHAELKHGMRQHFHKQLKRVWELHPALADWHIEDVRAARERRRLPIRDFGHPKNVKKTNTLPQAQNSDQDFISCKYLQTKEVLANEFKKNGYRFVPLAWEELDILCGIDVLFLRRGRPGNLFSEGDVDNRMKTLVDTLTMPTQQNQFPTTGPLDGENPFFVLLEDDRLLTNFSVETDDLFDPLTDNHQDSSMAKLVVTVTLKPWKANLLNSHFL